MAEEVRVEKVAERSVSHVVQQASHSHHAIDIGLGRNAGIDRLQRLVELLDGSACDVHHPQNVLEATVLGTWKNPPSGLELADLPHPLYPGMID